MALSSLARAYDVVLLDLDGCVWVGGEATPGATDAVAALRAAGKRVGFVTNNARHGTEEFVRTLWRLGFRASLEEVVTAGGALQHVLATERQGRTAVVVGSPAVHRHVADAGLRIVNGTRFAQRAEVAVVAGHDDFDFAELRAATQAVLGGAELIGGSRDAVFPMPDGPWPATGAVLAAVEYATGVRARTVGKPDAQIFRTALDRLGPGRALVVGDRLDSDLAGAAAAGLDGAIVLTGVATREEADGATDPKPVAVAPTLGDLILA
jgi:HAD superfamily hydrolase (TIGR01450 family)